MQNVKIRAIVGLGNPGVRYEKTRHNIGFLVVQAFAKRRGISLKREKKFEALYGKSETYHFLLPQTYMNLSGHPVAKMSHYYGIEPAEILVVTDDIALAFGQLRLKAMGGAGGHNGLKSLIQVLGQGFPRLRIGVGAPIGEVSDYVLGVFNGEQQTRLPEVIEASCDCLDSIEEKDFGRAMTQWNRSDINEER